MESESAKALTSREFRAVVLSIVLWSPSTQLVRKADRHRLSNVGAVWLEAGNSASIGDGLATRQGSAKGPRKKYFG